MVLQNRVLPTGDIVADPSRGTLTGNRGVLHDAGGNLGQARWRHPHWISCELSYKGLRRPIMAPGRWTELFFLDEAVALAAGHRPCGECRRADHLAFRAAWGRAFGVEVAAAEMDRVLHAARVVPRRRALATHPAPLAGLPDGTFIRDADDCLLVMGDRLLPFIPEGYGPPRPRPAAGTVTVLTPAPLVAVLCAGYRPRLHPTGRAAAP
jgi:hypothetical protein